MLRRLLPLLAAAPLAGCTPLEFFDGPGAAGMPVVGGNFATSARLPGPVLANYPQAPTDTCLRVDRVGRDVLAANHEVGLRPRFATIVKEHPEIFHQGTDVVWITEGLVKRCKTDGQLAAVLALQLGKMVAEREALGPRQDRDDGPPMQVVIGNGAAPGEVDLVALAERGKRDQERKLAVKKRQPPDAAALAETYLTNAGHSKADLAAVGPLLAEADRNYVIEKQFNGPPGGVAWRAVQP